MNALLASLVFPAIFYGHGSANLVNIVPQKAINAFTISYSNARELQWFTSDKIAEAVFGTEDCKTIVTYDKEGELLSTTRYFTEDHLPLNVVSNIKKDYPGKVIKLATEVMVEGQVAYSVNLEDAKGVYVVESDTDGRLQLRNKFTKQ